MPTPDVQSEALLRALIVEDDPDTVKLLQRWLGAAVTTAATSLAEGLAHLQESAFDVMLLDLGLPDSRGPATVARCRAAAPALPILIVTGEDDETIVRDAMRAGAEDHLIKGRFGAELLRRAVRYAIERSRHQAALTESEKRYRSLFENSVVGIIQSLPSGRLITANTAFARMYGYDSPESLLAEVSDARNQLHAHPGDRDVALRILSEKGVMEPKEFEVVRRDGTRFHVLASARTVKDSGGLGRGKGQRS